jgi:hypothetical protein
MSKPIAKLLRALHTPAHRQLGKRRAARTGSDALADLFAEHNMKIQTDVKAGGGLLDLDLDLDIDLDINLFGCGCRKRAPRKGKGGC